MDPQEPTLYSLMTTKESLQLRLELIEQMEAEYVDDKRELQSRIQELMKEFIYNGGHYWAENSPLLCKVVSELKTEAVLSEQEESECSEDELEQEQDPMEQHDELEEDLDDDENKLIIVTDDEEETHTELKVEPTEIRTNEIEIVEYDNDEDDNSYPRHKESDPSCVVLGPNGTTVDGFAFDQVVWTSVATATRSLLTLLFNDDILATHTLTGKPSPAFHGRERPPKKQLDPLKTADIVHCIVNRCKGANERQVRSSITSKCADTAKKYKRRDSRGSAEH